MAARTAATPCASGRDGSVCGSLGIDTSGYSIPYLASWSEDAELETIERAAATIDRIARRIEEALEPISAAGWQTTTRAA